MSETTTVTSAEPAATTESAPAIEPTPTEPKAQDSTAAPSGLPAGATPPAPTQDATSPTAQPSEPEPVKAEAPKAEPAEDAPVDTVTKAELDERMKALERLEKRQAKVEADLLNKEWDLYLTGKVKDGYEDIVRKVFPGANPGEAKTAAKIDEWLARHPDLVKPIQTVTQRPDDVAKYLVDDKGNKRRGSILVGEDSVRKTRRSFWDYVKGA